MQWLFYFLRFILNQNIGGPRSKHSKRSTQIKIEMGTQIRGQRHLLSTIIFEAFSYFQCFRILTITAILCQTLFDKFHIRQVWQLAGEYRRGHDPTSDYRPSGFKTQNYNKIKFWRIDVYYMYIKRSNFSSVALEQKRRNFKI